MKNVFRRLRGKLRQVERDEVRAVPCDLSVTVNHQNLIFQAIVPEDYSRIKTFDGEIEYFSRLARDLTKDDVFFDVGSFTGQVSCLAAKICERVVAVEPDGEFCERIRANAKLNGCKNILIDQCGLSNEPGELLLNTSGGKGWAPSFLDKGLAERVSVPVKTLDGLVEKIDLQPSVLKMDIEGFEFRALEGGKNTFENEALRAVYIEFHPDFIMRAGGDLGRTLGFLSYYGFRFEFFEARKNEISAIARR